MNKLLMATWLALAGAAAQAEITEARYVSKTGAELVARFNDQDQTVVVTLPDKRRHTLRQAVAASGARFTQGRHEFWEHQGEATFSVGGKPVFVGCERRQPGDAPRPRC